MNEKNHKPKLGPKAETLKAEDVDWKDAIRHALNKPKPDRAEVEGKAEKKKG